MEKRPEEGKEKTKFERFYDRYGRRYIIWTVLIFAMLIILDLAAYKNVRWGRDIVTMLILVGLWALADWSRYLIGKKLGAVNKEEADGISAKYAYNSSTEVPVIVCNTCNRDMTAAFKNTKTGEIREVGFITSEKEEKTFARACGLDSVKKLYR